MSESQLGTMPVCQMRRREDGRIMASIYEPSSSSITGVRVGGRDQYRCQNLCKDRAVLFPTLSPHRRIGTFWFPLITGVAPYGTPGNGSFSPAGQITRFRPAPEIVGHFTRKKPISFKRLQICGKLA